MTKKELIKLLERIPDNAEIRYFHDGMLLSLSKVNELREDAGWRNTYALSDIVSDKFNYRFK